MRGNYFSLISFRSFPSGRVGLCQKGLLIPGFPEQAVGRAFICLVGLCEVKVFQHSFILYHQVLVTSENKCPNRVHLHMWELSDEERRGSTKSRKDCLSAANVAVVPIDSIAH